MLWITSDNPHLGDQLLEGSTWIPKDDEAVPPSRKVILQDLAELHIALPHEKPALHINSFFWEVSIVA